jgi:hypothetical protein
MLLSSGFIRSKEKGTGHDLIDTTPPFISVAASSAQINALPMGLELLSNLPIVPSFPDPAKRVLF